MTTKEQQQRQEMVLPSFFYAIASSESRQLISLDELQRIITLDAMTQARTEDYRKNMRISSELAHQTKVMMPGITTSVLMDGRGKELRNVVKTTVSVQKCHNAPICGLFAKPANFIFKFLSLKISLIQTDCHRKQIFVVRSTRFHGLEQSLEILPERDSDLLASLDKGIVHCRSQCTLNTTKE